MSESVEWHILDSVQSPPSLPTFRWIVANLHLPALSAELTLLAQGQADHAVFKVEGSFQGWSSRLHHGKGEARRLVAVRMCSILSNSLSWVFQRTLRRFLFRGQKSMPHTQREACSCHNNLALFSLVSTLFVHYS